MDDTKEFEKKEYTTTIHTLRVITCDTCKLDIASVDSDHYYTVNTSHNCWGNDSLESHKELDFCSYECLTANMYHYYKDASDTYTYEIEREYKRNLKK